MEKAKEVFKDTIFMTTALLLILFLIGYMYVNVDTLTKHPCQLCVEKGYNCVRYAPIHQLEGSEKGFLLNITINLTETGIFIQPS